MSTHDWERLTSDVVCRFSMHPGKPLLPWPELPQDLAFLAHVIDAQRRELDEVRHGREIEQQMIRGASAAIERVREYVSAWHPHGEYGDIQSDILGLLDGDGRR